MFLYHYYASIFCMFTFFIMHASEDRAVHFEFKQAELSDVPAIVDVIDDVKDLL